MKKNIYLIICLYILQLVIFTQNSFSFRKYFDYNLNIGINDEDYKTNFDDFSFTLGSSETIYQKGFFELSLFFDISYFTFYEIKSIKAIENDIQKLAQQIKPKILKEKESIIEKIKELQVSYNLSISQSQEIPSPGSSAFALHDQIDSLYNNLITISNYEEDLDTKLQTSNTNYTSTVNDINNKKQGIYGVIDTVSSLDSVAQDALSQSSSPKAQKVSSFIGSSKFQAAKEIATNTAKIATDIVFEIETLNAKSKQLEEESKIEQQRSVASLEEASLISQIEAVESLNTKDIDNTAHIEKLQNLYSRYNQIRSIKQILNRNAEIADKYIRIPVVTGLSTYFKVFKFIVPYINAGFIVSIDNSIYKALSKINFGVRLGAGINFEFFDQKFIIGIHFKYWGITKNFISFGPTLAVRI